MPRPPRSYDEITRSTVVEPDLSFRPTPAQIAEGALGRRAMFDDELDLLERIEGALEERELKLPTVQIEVVRDKVVIRGSVPEIAMIRAIEHAVATVEGVATFEDHLVVIP